MRLEMSGWSIVIPPGWTTVIGDDQESLRLFLDAEVQNDEGFQKVAATGIELSVQQSGHQRRKRFKTTLNGVMRRHVRQGAPEVSSCHLGGREARAFTWTNGIQNIETVFVQIPDTANLALLRFDVVSPWHTTDIAARGRDAATRLLESITWH